MNQPPPPIRSEELTLASAGDRVNAYWAQPPSDVGARIVLIPDVHGLSPLYREMAARFAEQGVAALAVDLYSREGAPRLAGPADAMRFIAGLSDARILGDLAAAVSFLLEAPHGSGAVGITGFCMGGQYALLAACSDPRLRACVSFYGMVRYPETNALKPRSPLDAAHELACPYLGIFGEEDGLIPLADVEALRERLERAGKTFEIRTYAGCGHAFLNPNRPDAYRPEAAADAFRRAVEFFRTRLNGA